MLLMENERKLHGADLWRSWTNDFTPPHPMVALWVASISGIAAVQAWLVFQFWQGFGPAAAVLGVGLLGAEMSGLYMAARAGANGEKGKARVLYGLTACLFAFNLVTEVGAVAKLRGHEQAERSQAYDAQQRFAADLAAAERVMANGEGVRSRLELAPLLEAAEADLQRREALAEGRTPGPRESRALQAARDEAATLRSELARADRIAQAEQDKARLLASPQASAEAVAPVSPEVATFQRAIQGVTDALDGDKGQGGAPSAEAIETGLTIGLAGLVKLALTFGFWGAAVQLNRRRDGAADEASKSDGAPRPMKNITPAPQALPVPPQEALPPPRPRIVSGRVKTFGRTGARRP